MDDALIFIDQWLTDPATSDFQRCNVGETLRILDQKLADAWEHGRDAERQSLLKLRQTLNVYQEGLLQAEETELAKQPITETTAGIKCFSTLSQAIRFIAELLEQGQALELMATCIHIRRPAPSEPYYTQYFTARIFPQLQALHHEQDFPTRYHGRHFPKDGSHFKLGGHFTELGCIHIDFVRVEAGWVLDEIWECR